MNGTQGLPGSLTAALLRARTTGQPVAIAGMQGQVAYPNGNIGPPPGGGFGGSGAPAGAPALPIPPVPPAQVPPAFPAQPVAPSAPITTAGVPGQPGSPSGPAVAAPAPSLISNQPVGARSGLFTPTNQPVGATITAPSWWPTGSSAPQTQPPPNQANPNFTAGIQGLPGSPSGPAVAPPGGFPSAHVPDLVVTAKRYRQAHGLATPDDSDALNAESLAAARAGRTYFNPTLAAQYGQPLPAGVYGPRTDVVNALVMPPAAAQQPTQQTAQNLLQQGVY